MPYASLAQEEKFHADPKLRKYTPEFDAASKGMKLPKYAKGSKVRSHNFAKRAAPGHPMNAALRKAYG